MKTISCKQLGGACDKEFQADSFDEIAEMSKQHGKEMFERNDEAHLKAMNEMRELMQKPEAMELRDPSKLNARNGSRIRKRSLMRYQKIR